MNTVSKRVRVHRVLMIVLALAVVISALAGCSGSSTGSSTPTNTPAETSAASSSASSGNSSSPSKTSSKSTFTNKYGTETTKCAHPGCDNYIASSGDTNCCVLHSNKCLECGKYIDEDAMYCLSCIASAANKASSSGSSGSSSYSSNNSSSSGKVTGSGAGGYDMPNENDKSFSDYVKRVDPELYESLFG